MANAQEFSDETFVGQFETNDTHSTAVVEYMANQVRFLTGPLIRCAWTGALPNTSSSAIEQSD